MVARCCIAVIMRYSRGNAANHLFFAFALLFPHAHLYMKVNVGGQKGAYANDVALRFDGAEQVFDDTRADGSIMRVCFLGTLLLARRAAFRCLFTEPRWHTVRCQVWLSRRVGPALSIILLFFCLLFHYSPQQNEERDIGFYLCQLEDLELRSQRSE